MWVDKSKSLSRDSSASSSGKMNEVYKQESNSNDTTTWKKRYTYIESGFIGKSSYNSTTAADCIDNQLQQKREAQFEAWMNRNSLWHFEEQMWNEQKSHVDCVS